MAVRKRVAAALLAMAGCAWAQPVLHLKAASGRHPAVGRPRAGHVIVQFPAYPDAAVRNVLTQRGIRVLEYVPDNALMVSASATADWTGLGLVWAGSLSAADKISPLLKDRVSGAILAVFHPDVNPARARELARSFGFDVLTNPGLLPHQLVLSGALSRLTGFAESDEVSYLLPASPDLAAGIPVAGCAGAVTEAGPVGEYVLVGKGWPKDTAGNFTLQYFIRSLTERLDPSASRSEIEHALREWTKYANVSISPGQQGGSRTVDILFGRGAHGDSYPFDGPGGTLAHTFYPAPPNAEPIAGDMHLDADESWNIGANVDLFSVALHEAGHALGLGHSDRPGTVMYPYYRQVAGLSDDDIAGIRALYGAPSSTPSPPPSNPDPPPAPPTQPPGTNPSPAGDTVSPTLQIVSPGFIIVSTTSQSLAVSGTASDNIAVASVKWTTSTGGSGSAAGTTSWSASIPLLTGTNVVTIRAYDAAGNSGWRSLTVVRR